MNNLGSRQVEKGMNGWKFNILMLCWEYPPNIVGGLSRHVFGLSVQLAKMGHQVHVLTAGKGGLPSYEKISGVDVYRIQPINAYDDEFLSWIGGLNLAMIYKAEKLSAEIQFDFIHAHDWLVGSAAIVLKEALSLPLLTTFHATEHGRNDGIHTEMQQFIHEKEQRLIDDSDHLIVCSDYMNDDLLSIFKPAAEKISVIPNGIDMLPVQHKVDEFFPNLKQKKYIFSIGRIVKEKGFDTIIEYAAIAKEKGLDYYFVIAGKGPMLETYRRQIVARKLESYVECIGYISDEQRNALIEGCEMAVIPSLYEPFGIAALETMSFGKPSIVSNTGGLKGFVKHLQTGMLMIPGDVESLGEQIDYLMKNPLKAIGIGERGRQIVNSLYGWKRVAAETSRVVEEMVINKRVNPYVEFETSNKL